MLLKHEWKYLKRNLERPKRLYVGVGVYQIWTNVWPRKGGVTVSTTRFNDSVIKFIIRPTELADEAKQNGEYRINYKWFNGAVEKS